MEICDNGQDDDGDGQTDCDDTDCAAAAACQTGGCPGPDALIFGSTGTDQAVTSGGPVAISSRNSSGLLGVQFGVAATGDQWAFSGDLGTQRPDEQVIVELLFVDNQGGSSTPVGGNTATITNMDAVQGVERGPAIAGFAAGGDPTDGDFLSVELSPDVLPAGADGGFTVGYVADLDAGGNLIPATNGADCPVNELFSVVLGAGNSAARGDPSGDGNATVQDVVIIINHAVGNLPGPNCDAAMDADGNGTVDLQDAIRLMSYIFDGSSPAIDRTCQVYSNCNEPLCSP